MAKPTNSYVLVPENLPGFERDGLMTWYEQGKCADFLRKTYRHFSETKIVNFDIIQRQCCGEMVPFELLKQYQTVSKKTMCTFSSTTKTKIRSSGFRTDRKDIFFENETIKKLSKEIDNKKSKVLLRQSSF